MLERRVGGIAEAGRRIGLAAVVALELTNVCNGSLEEDAPPTAEVGSVSLSPPPGFLCRPFDARFPAPGRRAASQIVAGAAETWLTAVPCQRWFSATP